jgi:hypothetical protein
VDEGLSSNTLESGAIVSKSAFNEYRPFCNGPVMQVSRVIVTRPSHASVRGWRSGRHTMLLEGTGMMPLAFR